MNSMKIDPLAVTAALLIGGTLGIGYFFGLWATVRRLQAMRRPVLMLGASALLRIAIAVGIFYLLLSWGLAQLIAGMVGFFVTRLLAIRIWGPESRGDTALPQGKDG